ncbi:hypothetical protein [Lawsonia intracellularis]|uniref:hypothetical protein n=1 Tax=Lawsonia intracellularis TaxID=29546 RepID=UPI001181A28F|nr:hypothetical protein [Lawsonia intracellularis]UYH53618.1 hypothetical protein OCT60_07080 [Lawsonia intracellularis]
MEVSEQTSVNQGQSSSAVEEKRLHFYNIDFSFIQFSDTQWDEKGLEEATEILLYLSLGEIESLSPTSFIEMPLLEGEESELLLRLQ